ncbi:DedA family protein [Neobacillus drentensis]|uniref:DedA family protein n=1 Tax=Neobacillus drentensis TaxID=220684 RepID=UPI001F1C4E70|nr:DedA family protein [Neobacillus drentensis]ULT56416.1 DedA family protein [Neobacillus drentensis]
MNIESILHYINLYGYAVIFICLFFGIVGIPAPEESLLFLIGVLCGKHKLSFEFGLAASILGVFTGMLSAYACGKYLGYPFIKKFGKYVGITDERWQKAVRFYSKNVQKTILFGFYLPGLRQISPYFAGITGIPFRKFGLLSLLGTLAWTIPVMSAGLFTGKVFSINPAYIPCAGAISFLVFLSFIWFRNKRRARLTE